MQDDWRCVRCGSVRWVAASITGPVEYGGRAIKQCVPCGRYSDDPIETNDATFSEPPLPEPCLCPTHERNRMNAVLAGINFRRDYAAAIERKRAPIRRFIERMAAYYETG